MTGTQYTNVVHWTLANSPAADSAVAAKAVFNNMGVAFPSGSCPEILITLLSEEYMGWMSCTCQQAREFANAGVATVGVDPSRVVVILPDQPADALLSGTAAETAYAREAGDLALTERASMQFFAYAAASTTTTKKPKPLMTNVEYYNNIHAVALMEPSGGYTYCNIWAHKVFDECNIPYPVGGCTSELNQYTSGYDRWKSCDYKAAQSYANNGKAAIGIEPGHMVVVTPNNVPPRTGYTPSAVGDVFVSQSGADCFYDKTLSYSWTASDREKVKFFYYDK